MNIILNRCVATDSIIAAVKLIAFILILIVAIRSKIGDRETISSTTRDRDFRAQTRGLLHDDRQTSRSPSRCGLGPSQSCSKDTDSEVSSSRGGRDSRTPASHSPSHSADAHDNSISPAAESGRGNRSPQTSLNGYDRGQELGTLSGYSGSLAVGAVVKRERTDSPTLQGGDVLDDFMSDISDGDIPDIPPLAPLSPTTATTDEKDSRGDGQALDIDAASGEPSSQVQDVIQQKKSSVEKQENDVEEISDEEAEWSDDGDCMYHPASLLEADFDFDAEEWEDPVRVFEPSLEGLLLNGGPLKYFSNMKRIK